MRFVLTKNKSLFCNILFPAKGFKKQNLEMKFFKYTALIMAAFSMVACDDTTDMIGSSITNNVDKLTVTDATYNVITNSLAAGFK